ncbi:MULTISPECIES: DNA repair protein RecO [Prochlorococcus]|uniref:DNA repair protein RecO n=1 Tax=Prochlorococcus TaxID=1218 RepID=UPI0005339D22|nr:MULTISPECIES: DNA repair protein RecO [Prochlorococcus]KGG13001.1 DNA recombination and repair protein RecO [Prochlorococcus sp. MIT 0601]
MRETCKINGLSLKVGPLGENDRLLTVLSEQEGIVRLAVPGARRPKSSLSAASPLTLLELQVSGKSGLRRVRQLKVVKSFSKLGEQLETLAAAQVLAELSIILVGTNDPQHGILEAVLEHLDRLENTSKEPLYILANCVQSLVHLLALGGYSLPTHTCCRSGKPLQPPIGNWDWRCSLLENEGFAIGSIPEAYTTLNASELALLQRLIKPQLPLKKNGEVLGPIMVWEKFFILIEKWIAHHLSRELNTMKILKMSIISKQLN